MKVLMIGPARSVNGGISAVVNNYYNAGLDKRVELKYIGTMEDGSKVHKLKVAATALCKFVGQVPKCDLVHINMASDVSLYRKIPFIYIAKLFGKKLVIHQHGGNFKEFFYSECGRKRQKFIQRTLEKADVFLVVASYLGDIFKNIISEDKVLTLANAIEIPLQIAEKEPGQKLLFLGRLCKEKGIRELLEAVSELKDEYPELELYLGGVWIEQELKELADRYREYVHQLGWIGQEEKEKYLHKCNIFVLPTYFEGLPMSLLEGMAYSCACIASKVGGIPQVIEDGVDGILIQPENKEELKAAISKILQNTGLQQKLGKAGREKVEREFELSKSVDILVKIYQNLIQI